MGNSVTGRGLRRAGKPRFPVDSRARGAGRRYASQDIRNKLSELRTEGLITDDGKRPVTYHLVSSSSEHPRGSDSDDTSNPSVSSFFANPPDWLPKQIEVYRTDPARHLKPLCATVAAEVLGDSLRADEVREEVEWILKENAQG